MDATSLFVPGDLVVTRDDFMIRLFEDGDNFITDGHVDKGSLGIVVAVIFFREEYVDCVVLFANEQFGRVVLDLLVRA